MDSRLRKFGKALVATAYAGGVAAYAALSGDQHIDPDEGLSIVIAVLTAAGVWLVPLAPQYRWTKTAVAGLLAAAQAATVVILGGLDPNEIVLIVLAGAAVLGVGAAPAVSNNGVAAGKAVDGKPNPGVEDIA